MQAACSSQWSRTPCRQILWFQATHSAVKPSWYLLLRLSFLSSFSFFEDASAFQQDGWLWSPDYGRSVTVNTYSASYLRICTFSLIFWVWKQRRNSRDGCSVSNLLKVLVLGPFTLSEIYVSRNWTNSNLYYTTLVTYVFWHVIVHV